MSGYIVPATRATHTIRVKNSRFIADIAPAEETQIAEGFISAVKDTYPDATHHVPAYIIGHGSSKISHASDDGEPSGTAGRPALAVLEGSGLGDVVIVITRYFGGTKLGTGGLVRAYSEATRAVVEKVPKAQKLRVHILTFSVPYSLYETLVHVVHSNAGVVSHDQFTTDVRLTVKIPSESYEEFYDEIMEISSGQIEPRILDQNATAIMPQ